MKIENGDGRFDAIHKDKAHAPKKPILTIICPYVHITLGRQSTNQLLCTNRIVHTNIAWIGIIVYMQSNVGLSAVGLWTTFLKTTSYICRTTFIKMVGELCNSTEICSANNSIRSV